MKCCKINIKQEWIDTDTPVYREAVREQFMAQMATDGKVPEMSTFKENTYFPITVYEQGSLGVTTYLVKENERGIFTDLMTITSDTLNQAVEKAVNDKWEIRHYEIEANAWKRFKNLPWYKRLFV